jgi:hypothetical protein
MTKQNNGAPQQQHVIASPNPTVDDGRRTPAGPDPKVEATKLPPAQGTTAAPMKTTTPKPKPKRRRTRPRG